MNQNEIAYNPATNRIAISLPGRPDPVEADALRAAGYRAKRSPSGDWSWQAPPTIESALFALGKEADGMTDAELDARVPIVDELPDYAAKATRRSELAAKRDSDAETARRAAAAAVEGIEPGQPVHADKPSGASHRRALRRAHAAEGRAREAASKADYHRRRAASAERQAEKHSDPHFIAARLDDAETELRRYNGTSSALRWFMRRRVEYWREQASYNPVPRLYVRVGDLVRRRNGGAGWWVVAKINPKTYKLVSGPCSFRCPHADVVEVQRPGGES